MPLRLQFVGCGDAFGSGGRFHTCFHVQWDEKAFLIDCGASSMSALRKFGVDLNAIGTIIISHLHGDHFGGLPFFLLSARLIEKRRQPLLIAGPPGIEERLTRAMEVFFPGASETQLPFELKFVELLAGRSAALNGIEVTPYEVKHPSGAPSYALRIRCGEKTIAYTGDTEWTDNLIPAGAGADLLIAECYCFEKKIRNHIDLPTLKEQLPKIGAKRVILTHLGPEMLANPAEIPFECAEDGKVVDI